LLVHSGTLYVYFVEKESNRAPRRIEPENLKLYTMQLMFRSNEETEKAFSFSTTSFEDTFSVKRFISIYLSRKTPSNWFLLICL